MYRSHEPSFDCSFLLVRMLRRDPSPGYQKLKHCPFSIVLVVAAVVASCGMYFTHDIDQTYIVLQFIQCVRNAMCVDGSEAACVCSHTPWCCTESGSPFALTHNMHGQSIHRLPS